MFRVTSRGSFSKTESFLRNAQRVNIVQILHEGGREGVVALSLATPVESGLTAASWRYEVSARNGRYSISWLNSDVEGGFPVAIMLQYGYGTGTGGYVQGRDYINPAIQPIFDRISNKVWKAVTSG